MVASARKWEVEAKSYLCVDDHPASLNRQAPHPMACNITPGEDEDGFCALGCLQPEKHYRIHRVRRQAMCNKEQSLFLHRGLEQQSRCIPT